MSDTHTINVRLPRGLHEELKRLAEKNMRSVHSEVVWALIEHSKKWGGNIHYIGTKVNEEEGA